MARLEDLCRRLRLGYVVVRDSSFHKVLPHELLTNVAVWDPPPTTPFYQDFASLLDEPSPYSDVSFLVEGISLKAHKVFLAARYVPRGAYSVSVVTETVPNHFICAVPGTSGACSHQA